MLTLAGACSLALVGCGGGVSRSISMSEDVEVYGDLGDEDVDEYLGVKGRTHKFSVRDDKLMLELEVETLQEMPAVKLDDIDNFYVEVYDKDDKNVRLSDGSILYMTPSNPEVVQELSSSPEGKVYTFQFECPLSGETEATEVLDQIDSFDFNIDLIPTDDAGEGFSMSDDSNDWDEVLDSYESYVDQYIALYKKAMNGDMSAMSEYGSFLEKASDLGQKMSDATDEMSPAQVRRYREIQEKLTSLFQ